ncbi:MAG TPA: hypothetical protein VN714_23925, partial [Trebonia sp.]|nr:hypothetical protein [Trebonia sp.]
MLRRARRRALASGDSCASAGESSRSFLGPLGFPMPLCPRAFIVLDVLDVLRQEGRQVGQLVQ